MVETNSKHDNIDDIKEVTSDKASFEDNEEKSITSSEEEVLEKNRPATTSTKKAWKMMMNSYRCQCLSLNLYPSRYR